MTAHNINVFFAGWYCGCVFSFAVCYCIVRCCGRKKQNQHPVHPVHPVKIPDSKFHKL
jgi:hypothetical protein